MPIYLVHFCRARGNDGQLGVETDTKVVQHPEEGPPWPNSEFPPGRNVETYFPVQPNEEQGYQWEIWVTPRT